MATVIAQSRQLVFQDAMDLPHTWHTRCGFGPCSRCSSDTMPLASRRPHQHRRLGHRSAFTHHLAIIFYSHAGGAGADPWSYLAGLSTHGFKHIFWSSIGHALQLRLGRMASQIKPDNTARVAPVPKANNQPQFFTPSCLRHCPNRQQHGITPLPGPLEGTSHPSPRKTLSVMDESIGVYFLWFSFCEKDRGTHSH